MMSDQSYEYYEDMRFPFTGQNIDTSTGRIDYDYTDLGVAFAANARYTEEVVGMICQLSHGRKPGSMLYPHIHWLQNQAAMPNFLMLYRLVANGAAPGGWTPALLSGNKFIWSAGMLLQISSFAAIDASSLVEVSDFMDIKFYRDTTNASGLFGGADPIGDPVTVKELDVHIITDRVGSKSEYSYV